MSTRATIHFESRRTRRWDPDTGESVTLDEPVVETEAIIYRHSDGYPEGLGLDLVRFINEVRQLQDTRLSDPAYLAAKWIVFDVSEYHAHMTTSNEQRKANGEKPYYADPVPRLDFLSIGVVMSDPGDIEYRYHVICDGEVESITWEHIGLSSLVIETGTISTLEGVTA